MLWRNLGRMHTVPRHFARVDGAVGELDKQGILGGLYIVRRVYVVFALAFLVGVAHTRRRHIGNVEQLGAHGLYLREVLDAQRAG